MNSAWETTSDDVTNIANTRFHKKISATKAAGILNELDTDKIEEAALAADMAGLDPDIDNDAIMSRQTDAAYDEIERQIKEGKLL